jgi:hypothetical protein
MPLRIIGWTLCSLLAYCTDGGVHRAKPEPPASIASLNAELPVRIPEQARLPGVLEITAADLSSFPASSPLAERPLNSRGSGGSFGSDHAFWDPGCVPSLRSAETT